MQQSDVVRSLSMALGTCVGGAWLWQSGCQIEAAGWLGLFGGVGAGVTTLVFTPDYSTRAPHWKAWTIPPSLAGLAFAGLAGSVITIRRSFAHVRCLGEQIRQLNLQTLHATTVEQMKVLQGQLAALTTLKRGYDLEGGVAMFTGLFAIAGGGFQLYDWRFERSQAP